MNLKNIARLIESKMTTESLTLEQAESASGLSKSIFCYLKQEKHIPDINTLLKLAAWLKIPVDLLMQDDYPLILRPEMSTLDKIDTVLFSDKSLTTEQVYILSQTMRSFYCNLINSASTGEQGADIEESKGYIS